MSFYAIVTALVIGSVLGFAALGLYVSFRVLRFPDLTCQGSFPIGACFTVVCVNAGLAPIVAVVLGCAAGVACGYATALCNTVLRVPAIIASIVILMMAYSVNLIIMGKPIQSMAGADLFMTWDVGGPYGREVGSLLVLATSLSAVSAALCVFFKTETGLAMRLVGAGPILAEFVGISRVRYTRLGLCLANGLVALSGALFAQYQRFADVNLGAGILVSLLAAVFLGVGLERTRRKYFAVGWQIACVLLGTLVHRCLIAAAYSIGFGAEYFSALSAGLVLLALALPIVRAEANELFVRS